MCLSLQWCGVHTLRQRIYATSTNKEAAVMLSKLCEEERILCADDIIDRLEREFVNSPPTIEEVAKWKEWQGSSQIGSINDYTATTLLIIHRLALLKSSAPRTK